LKNVGFSAVRRFINRFVFNHDLTVPQDLNNVIGKMRTRHNSKPSLHERNSSLSEMIEPDWTSYRRLLSTSAHMANPRPSEEKENSRSHSSISSSHASNRSVQFYKPTQPFEKKLSNLDLNNSKCSKKSLNRSHMGGRQSANISVENSFIKKNRP
jgi:hypothetical protein